MKMYAQAIIQRPIEEVFKYLAAVVNDVHWRDEIISAEITSKGELGIGSTGYHRAKQGEKELELT